MQEDHPPSLNREMQPRNDVVREVACEETVRFTYTRHP
jgi:hypothetical protein